MIPLAHVDHFTEVDEELAGWMMRVAHRVGRRLRTEFGCERTGFVVHGHGVPHAYLLVVPQHGPTDTTSGRFAKVREKAVVFDLEGVRVPPRAELDEHARRLGG